MTGVTETSDRAPAPTRRSVFILVVSASIGVVILSMLGVWQVQRLGWKTDLIERVETGLSAPPVPAPGPDDWAALDTAAMEYTPMSVTGTFDHARTAYVTYTLTRPKGPAGGLGYMVMTPLLTDDGWTAYVNRGFVPADRRAPETRPESIVEGETTVVGLLRGRSLKPWFVPGDNAADNVWLSRDPALYAAAYGAPSDRIAPYIIDAVYDPDLPGGLPQGGETIVSFSNNHLGYALTWFGLAAALAVMAAAFVVGRLRAQSDSSS